MRNAAWPDLSNAKAGQTFLAVKNKRVYGIYHTASRSLADFGPARNFIAKTLYPQQFADIDPNKTYLDFYRQNLPVVPNGTFYLYPKGQ